MLACELRPISGCRLSPPKNTHAFFGGDKRQPEIGLRSQANRLLPHNNNSLASSKFFSHWRCLLTLFALKSPKTLLGIKRIVYLLKILSWKPSFYLADWHESSHCCCHTITRSRLRRFSVIGDVYFTLFALKSPKTLLGIKRIASLIKILSWKPSFSKKIWPIDTSLHTGCCHTITRYSRKVIITTFKLICLAFDKLNLFSFPALPSWQIWQAYADSPRELW